MQITTLGVSGSGKSNFMFTLFDLLYSPANAKNNFYLTGTGNAFEDTLRKDEHSIFKNRVFAKGTSSPTNRTFQFRSFERKWLTVNWFDYKGGIVNEYLSDEYEQQDKYFHILKESNALIVFVNLYDLFHDFLQKNDKNENYFTTMKTYVGAANITNVISQLNDDHHENLDILFILSQCDTVPKEYWDTEDAIKALYENVLKQIFGGAFNIIHDQKTWRYGFIPVSCVGIGTSVREVTRKRTAQRGAIVKDEITGIPQPINVLNAFFWLIKRELEKQRKISIIEVEKLENRKKQLDQEMQHEIQCTRDSYRSKKASRPMLAALLEDKLLKDKGGRTRHDAEMDVDIDLIKKDFLDRRREVDKEINTVKSATLPQNLIDMLNKSTCAIYEL